MWCIGLAFIVYHKNFTKLFDFSDKSLFFFISIYFLRGKIFFVKSQKQRCNLTENQTNLKTRAVSARWVGASSSKPETGNIEIFNKIIRQNKVC